LLRSKARFLVYNLDNLRREDKEKEDEEELGESVGSRQRNHSQHSNYANFNIAVHFFSYFGKTQFI